MAKPTTAEMVLSLRDWVRGAHELPDDAQLLTDVADRLEAAESELNKLAQTHSNVLFEYSGLQATIQSIKQLCEEPFEGTTAYREWRSKLQELIKGNNDGRS